MEIQSAWWRKKPCSRFYQGPCWLLALWAAMIQSACLGLSHVEVDMNLEALVTMHDAHGAPRIGVGVSSYGALGLSLFDDQGNNRLGLGAGRDGALGFTYFDGRGMARLGIAASRWGALGFVHYDRNGESLVGVSVSEEGILDVARPLLVP